jgi:hypothetical protein
MRVGRKIIFDGKKFYLSLLVMAKKYKAELYLLKIANYLKFFKL